MWILIQILDIFITVALHWCLYRKRSGYRGSEHSIFQRNKIKYAVTLSPEAVAEKHPNAKPDFLQFLKLRSHPPHTFWDHHAGFPVNGALTEREPSGRLCSGYTVSSVKFIPFFLFPSYKATTMFIFIWSISAIHSQFINDHAAAGAAV